MLARWTLALIGLVALTSPALAAWNGTHETRDGVRHAINGEDPMTTTRVPLEPLWRVGGLDDEEVLFGVISQLVHDDDGNLYVLDRQLSEIQIFSPAGEYLTTIGRAGEGPGEFQNPADMYLGPGRTLGVVQIFPGKVVQIGLDGEPRGNFTLPAAGSFQLVMAGRANDERITLAGTLMRNEAGQGFEDRYLKAFAPDGTELATFYEESVDAPFGGRKFDEKTFTSFQQRWAMASDGRVAAAPSFDDYTIHVWNPDGSPSVIIQRPEHELAARTDGQIERFQKLYDGITRWSPQSTFHVSETHEAVDRMTFRADGSLWVLSSRGSWTPPDGVMAVFDVYDRDGRFVKQVEFAGEGDPTEDYFFFAGDRLYMVTDFFSSIMTSFADGDTEAEDTEPEPISLIAFDLSGVDVGIN